jgi:hypothetical protein
MLQAIRRSIKGTIKKDLQPEPVAEPKTKVESAKPRKAKPIYTFRDVLKEIYRPLIDKEIPHKPGEPEYIRSYQMAVTTVWNTMNEEEVEQVQEMVDKWNEEGAPSDVQLKYVLGWSAFDCFPF